MMNTKRGPDNNANCFREYLGSGMKDDWRVIIWMKLHPIDDFLLGIVPLIINTKASAKD